MAPPLPGSVCACGVAQAELTHTHENTHTHTQSTQESSQRAWPLRPDPVLHTHTQELHITHTSTDIYCTLTDVCKCV